MTRTRSRKTHTLQFMPFQGGVGGGLQRSVPQRRLQKKVNCPVIIHGRGDASKPSLLGEGDDVFKNILRKVLQVLKCFHLSIPPETSGRQKLRGNVSEHGGYIFYRQASLYSETPDHRKYLVQHPWNDGLQQKHRFSGVAAAAIHG